MQLLLAWVWLPLLVLVTAAGWGMLVERAAGVRLPGALVPALGAAAAIVATQFTALTDATAELGLPVVAAGAIAGWALGRSRIAFDRAAGVAAAIPFVVLAAPIVLSGGPTFSGYAVLGDTAIHFMGVDFLPQYGRADPLAVLPASSYANYLHQYFGIGYPSGTHTLLGALRPLAGLDAAWILQPFLVALTALSAMCAYALAADVPRRPRAVVAAVAALPALYVGYVLVVSVKEVGAVLALLLGAGLAHWYAGLAALSVRASLLLAFPVAAGIAVISLSILPWLGLLYLALVVHVVRARGLRRAGPGLAAAGALAALLTLPAILYDLPVFVGVATAVTTEAGAAGNLIAPLLGWQLFPAWPVGDYRLIPSLEGLMMAGAGVLAVLVGLRHLRSGWVWMTLLASLGATIYVVRRGSPWADAKGMMITTPAVALAAGVGLAQMQRGAARTALGLTLLLGVGWSAALAYHDATLAPYDRLRELEEVGRDLTGPTLVTEFDETAKHFLRDAAPVTLSEQLPQSDTPPLRFGTTTFGRATELADVNPAFLAQYRSLVVRRSPYGIQPAGFRRSHQGRWYEVWERGEATPLPCGGEAAVAGFDESVALPNKWTLSPDVPGVAEADGPGRVTLSVLVDQAGPHQVWLGGSIGRAIRLRVDETEVGAVADARNYDGVFELAGEIDLAAGTHTITLDRGGGELASGDGSGREIGPVVLAPPGYRCDT